MLIEKRVVNEYKDVEKKEGKKERKDRLKIK